MRIIRPLDGMAAVTTSNAPDDDVAVWEVQGRDLLKTLYKPVFDVVGDTMIAVSSNGGMVYKQAISTGVSAPVGFSAPRDVVNIKISPNENLFYLCHKSGPAGSKETTSLIIEVSSGLVKYNGGTVSNREVNMDAFSWSDDSNYAYIGSGFRFGSVDTATFSSHPFETSARSITRKGDLMFSVSNGPSIIRLASFTGSGATPTFNENVHISNDYLFVRYNSVRDEVLVFRRDGFIAVFHANDLNNVPPGSRALLNNLDDVYIKPHAVITTDTHLITRSLSTSPVWKFYNLSDYSLDSNLTIPALPDRGEGIAIGTNYTVVQQNQGIAIVDNTTRDLVAQQNPNVIKGDTYIYNDKVYEVLTNNNVQPDEGAAAEPPTWLDLGAINRLRMFDNKIDSVTRGNGSLNITIDAKQALNGIALFNVTAATVQITMTDGTYGLVYDTGEVLMRDSSQILGWYDWFFSSRPKMRDLARVDLPTFPNAIVEVTLTGDNVSLGEIVIGRVQKIGETQYGGTSVGIIDSSIKERDDFGNFVIAERPFSKRVEFDVHVPTSGISGVQNILASYRAKPVVYVGAEGEEALVVFGFYRDFQINYTSYSIAASTITVEGL